MAKMTRVTDKTYRLLVERRSKETPLVTRFGYHFWAVTLEEPERWTGSRWKSSLQRLEENGLLLRTMEGNYVRFD